MLIRLAISCRCFDDRMWATTFRRFTLPSRSTALKKSRSRSSDFRSSPLRFSLRSDALVSNGAIGFGFSVGWFFWPCVLSRPPFSTFVNLYCCFSVVRQFTVVHFQWTLLRPQHVPRWITAVVNSYVIKSQPSFIKFGTWSHVLCVIDAMDSVGEVD